jgi:hypothetical protein
MKTLRRIMAVGLLLGCYHLGIAQSNEVPKFSSEAEKSAWKAANPNHPIMNKKEVKAATTTRIAPSAAANQGKLNEAKKATRLSNNQPARVNATHINVKNNQTKAVAPVRAANANLAAKRLPANYPNSDNRTSKSDQ